MGVQLNIKDEQTVTLARELASRIGKSVTETIREALEEKSRSRDLEQATHLAETLATVRKIQDEVRRVTPAETLRLTVTEIMGSIYGDDPSGAFGK